MRYFKILLTVNKKIIGFGQQKNMKLGDKIYDILPKQ